LHTSSVVIFIASELGNNNNQKVILLLTPFILGKNSLIDTLYVHRSQNAELRHFQEGARGKINLSGLEACLPAQNVPVSEGNLQPSPH
jgi:hypothetical protein